MGFLIETASKAVAFLRDFPAEIQGRFKTDVKQENDFNDIVIDKADAVGIIERHNNRCLELFKEKDGRIRLGQNTVGASILFASFELYEKDDPQSWLHTAPLQAAAYFMVGYAVSHIVRNIAKPGKGFKTCPRVKFGETEVKRSDIINLVRHDNDRWVKRVKQYNTTCKVTAGFKFAAAAALACVGNSAGAAGIAASAFRDIQQMKNVEDFIINKSDIGARNEEKLNKAAQNKLRSTENEFTP